MTRSIYLIIYLLTVLIAVACMPGDETLPTLIVLDDAQPAEEADAPPVDGEQVAIAGLLDFWEPASGQIRPDQPALWRFRGSAGDQITLRVVAPGLEASLTLRADDGTPLGDGASIRADLPTTGVYEVIVSARRAGNYEIGLGYADRPNPADITTTPLPEVVGVPTPIPVYADLGTFISRLTHNNTVGGTKENNGENHIYTFDGEAGDYVQVEMNRVSGEIVPRITLFDPAGMPIATDSRSGESGAMLRNIQLPAAGVYSVQTSSSGPGGYSVRLLKYEQLAPVVPTLVEVPTETPIPTYDLPTAAPATSGMRLGDHQAVTGFLEGGGVAIFSFDARAGEIYTIGASPFEGSGLLPEMEVSNPEGNIIARAQAGTSNAGGDALITSLLAEFDGTYTIFLRGEANSAGQYTLAYGRGSSWGEILRGEIPFDQRSEGVIARRGWRDVWTLELRAGDIVTAAVAPGQGSNLDPVLELVHAATGEVIAADNNSGGQRSPLIRRAEIARTGVYLLRVRASQAASSGTYSLIWRYVNVAPTSTPPPASAPVLLLEDTIAENEYRFYPFQARAGQWMRIRVLAEEDSLFDPVAALLDANGDVLIEVDDTEGDLNPRFVYQIPADGTYNVRVNGYLSGGPYSVIVEELLNGFDMLD